MEFQIVRPNGDLRTVTLTSQVLLDQEGSPGHIFGACQDVTDDRRAQKETFARQKLETVGTLANGIAHDFNNLLGGVLAQAELALSDLTVKINPEEELKTIRDVAIRGSEIVRELMIYAGKENLVVELVDVSRIVQEMLALLRVSVSKHAVLRTDLGEGLPAVPASAAQIRQIVLNLVLNASDAIGDHDGMIRVTMNHLRLDQEAAREISHGLGSGDYVQLEVSDTGCCIPGEMQAKVFDPFFTTKSSGRGLGLAVVQGIVLSLGGAIHLTSALGKGTTLKLLLPCAGSPAETVVGVFPIQEPARPTPRATVLVVEDETTLRQAVVKMLQKAGFEVLEAATGSAAIDLLRTSGREVDVILLDMTLPGASRSFLKKLG